MLGQGKNIFVSGYPTDPVENLPTQKILKAFSGIVSRVIVHTSLDSHICADEMIDFRHSNHDCFLE